MEIQEYDWYVVVTKYGFLYNVYEEYSDIEEDDELYLIDNVEFTNKVNRAMRFKNPEDDAPKYSVSKEYNYKELTIEKWTKEIGGELVNMKIIFSEDLIPNSGNLELSKTEKYVLEDSKFFKGQFPHVNLY